jgi:hypothetical protein
MWEGKWPDFGVNINSFFCVYDPSNVLLFNEIIACHHFSWIDSNPPYYLMLVTYLFDGET